MKTNVRKYLNFKIDWYLIAASSLVLVSTSKVQAQSNIVPDNTLGDESSIVNPNADGFAIELITGGAQRGQNLFHSFSEFNVSEGRSAYFSSPNADIANILSRVTGNNISEIFGTLGTIGESQPNLFLINPSGIIFGDNASLDVGGSFVATTADSIQFGEQGFFDATNPELPPLLTVQPSAFLVNQLNNGSITNQSVANSTTEGFVVNGEPGRTIEGLQVLDGNSLLLLASEINLDGGFLVANDGNIELGAIAGEETISLSIGESSLSFDMPDDAAKGNIFIGNTSLIATTGNVGGNIFIEANNLNIDGNSVVVTGIAENLGTVDAQSGNITFNVDNAIAIDNSLIINSAASNSLGNSGDIQFDAENITLTDASLVSTNNLSVGDGGNISFTAGNIAVNNNSVLDTQAFDTGNGGNVSLSARESISFSNSQVNTRGRIGGEIFFSAQNLNILNSNVLAGIQSGLGEVNQPAKDIVFDIAATVTINNSLISNLVGEGTDANAGNIQINGGNLELTSSSLINSKGEGEGNAGAIDINVLETAEFNNSILSTEVAIEGIGNAGNIEVNANNVFITGGTLFNSSVAQNGNAGDITLEANNDFVASNSLINSNIGTSAGNTATGNVGSIFVEAKNVSLSDTAQLQAGLFSGATGEPGIISVEAEDIASFTGTNTGIFSNTNPGSFGNSSDVKLAAKSIFLDENALVLSSTGGQGNGGNIEVNTNLLNLDNASSISASTLGEGNAGNVNIETNNLSIDNGANISSATFPDSRGDGGNIIVSSLESIDLKGSIFTTDNIFESGINAQTQGMGNGGNINISTSKLTISEGAGINANAVLNASGEAGDVTVNASDSIELIGGTEFTPSSISVDTMSFQNAGNLNIATNNLTIRDGAQIGSATFGEGNGGNIIVDVPEILVTGTSENLIPSGIFASAEAEATGNGGNLEIQTERLSIINGAEVSVSSRGSGRGGSIDIQGNRLILDKNALLDAQTLSNNGGNISLNIADLITLNNQSNISATAGTAEAGGDGGNINIDTEFIVAFSNGSNDITANAFEGSGGNIDINAESLFGIEARSSTPANDTNDIDASSQFGLDGDVAINTPDVDPTRGLDNLPTNIVDASRLITRNCLDTGDDRLNEFIITGRGGLPSNPNELLSGDATISADWLSLPETNINSAPAKTTTETISETSVVEAKGWKMKPDGTVVLIAENNSSKFTIPWMGSHSCNSF